MYILTVYLKYSFKPYSCLKWIKCEDTIRTSCLNFLYYHTWHFHSVNCVVGVYTNDIALIVVIKDLPCISYNVHLNKVERFCMYMSIAVEQLLKKKGDGSI